MPDCIFRGFLNIRIIKCVTEPLKSAGDITGQNVGDCLFILLREGCNLPISVHFDAVECDIRSCAAGFYGLGLLHEDIAKQLFHLCVIGATESHGKSLRDVFTQSGGDDWACINIGERYRDRGALTVNFRLPNLVGHLRSTFLQIGHDLLR